MKTNTPLNFETQIRIQQLRFGVDWNADHFRVVPMCDSQLSQLAQRFNRRRDAGIFWTHYRTCGQELIYTDDPNAKPQVCTAGNHK